MDSDIPTELPPPAYELTQNEFDAKISQALERSLTITPTPRKPSTPAPEAAAVTQEETVEPHPALANQTIDEDEEWEEWDEEKYQENVRQQRMLEQAKGGAGSSEASGSTRSADVESKSPKEKGRSVPSAQGGHEGQQGSSSRSPIPLEQQPARPLEKERPSWYRDAGLDRSSSSSSGSNGAGASSNSRPALPQPTPPQSQKERPSWYKDAGLDQPSTSSPPPPAPQSTKERSSWYAAAGLGADEPSGSSRSLDTMARPPSSSASSSSLMDINSPRDSPSVTSPPRSALSPSQESAHSPSLLQSPAASTHSGPIHDLPPDDEVEYDDEAPPAFTPMAPTLPGPSAQELGLPPFSPPPPISPTSPSFPVSAPSEQTQFAPVLLPSAQQQQQRMSLPPMRSRPPVSERISTRNAHIAFDPSSAYSDGSAPGGRPPQSHSSNRMSMFGGQQGTSGTGQASSAASFYNSSVSSFLNGAPTRPPLPHQHSPPQPSNPYSTTTRLPSPPQNPSYPQFPRTTSPANGRPYDSLLAESLGPLAESVQARHAEGHHNTPPANPSTGFYSQAGAFYPPQQGPGPYPPYGPTPPQQQPPYPYPRPPQQPQAPYPPAQNPAYPQQPVWGPTMPPPPGQRAQTPYPSPPLQGGPPQQPYPSPPLQSGPSPPVPGPLPGMGYPSRGPLPPPMQQAPGPQWNGPGGMYR